MQVRRAEPESLPIAAAMSESTPSAAPVSPAETTPLASGDGSRPAAPAALERLRQLPVPIIVKLAEKRIEMGQLLAMGPGAIITFEKSCEDLLDLYVNNQPYCRGEAVKIGEKFGIKVCEIGSARDRASAVLAAE